MEIFNNKISRSVEKKAIRKQKQFIRKYGDDRNKNYYLTLEDNEVITPSLGVKIIRLSKEPVDFAKQLAELPSKPIIIGNIRMGFLPCGST